MLDKLKFLKFTKEEYESFMYEATPEDKIGGFKQVIHKKQKENSYVSVYTDLFIERVERLLILNTDLVSDLLFYSETLPLPLDNFTDFIISEGEMRVQEFNPYLTLGQATALAAHGHLSSSGLLHSTDIELLDNEYFTEHYLINRLRDYLIEEGWLENNDIYEDRRVNGRTILSNLIHAEGLRSNYISRLVGNIKEADTCSRSLNLSEEIEEILHSIGHEDAHLKNLSKKAQKKIEELVIKYDKLSGINTAKTKKTNTEEVDTQIKTKRKGSVGMFDKMFGEGSVGQVEGVGISLMTQELAIPVGDKFYTFNKQTKQIQDVTEMILEVELPVMKFPVLANTIAEGDIIVHNNSLVFVEDIENGNIVGVDPSTQNVVTVRPIAVAMLGGNTFIIKLQTFDFGGSGDTTNSMGGLLGGSNPMMQMMMMQSLTGKDKGDNPMSQMMMMQMMGSMGNMFGQQPITPIQTAPAIQQEGAKTVKPKKTAKKGVE